MSRRTAGGREQEANCPTHEPLAKQFCGKKRCVVIGGHSHTEIHETYLVKSGAEGRYLGSTMVTWDLDSKEALGVSANNFKMKRKECESAP